MDTPTDPVRSYTVPTLSNQVSEYQWPPCLVPAYWLGVRLAEADKYNQLAQTAVGAKEKALYEVHREEALEAAEKLLKELKTALGVPNV